MAYDILHKIRGSGVFLSFINKSGKFIKTGWKKWCHIVTKNWNDGNLSACKSIYKRGGLTVENDVSEFRSVWKWSVPQMAIELGRMKCSAIEIIEFQLKKSRVPYIWETIWNLTWHVGRSLQPPTGWPEPSIQKGHWFQKVTVGLPAPSVWLTPP